MKISMRNLNGLLKPISSLLTAIALISGFLLTFIGLSHLPWPAAIPWSDKSSVIRYVGFLLIAIFFVSLLAKGLHRNTVLAGAIASVLLAIGAGALWPLLVTLWFAAASAILGGWLLGKLRTKDEDWFNCFLTGAGVYGTAVGLLAHFSVNYPGIYGVALAFPMVLGWKVLRQWFIAFVIWIARSHASADRVSYWLDIAIAIVALVFFTVALMPELGHDALATHLFVPAHLATRHQWGFDAGTYAWAVMPMLGDWIFSYAYMLAGETAARLFNVAFIFLLAWQVRSIVLWAGGTMIGARWAVLIFLSSPLTFTEGSSLFIESVWASFVVAGTFAILRVCSSDEGQRVQLITAGILLGCSLATKAVTLTALPVLLLILVWRYKTWLRAGMSGPLMVGLGCFLIIGFIPYGTAWWLTGNPIFPFFNEIFHSSLYPAENFRDTTWSQYPTWDFPYRVTFQTNKFLEASPGAAGFQWLLMLVPASVALIAVWHRRGMALLLIGILSILLCFLSAPYLRYIFPAYTVLIAAIGVGLTSFHKVAVVQTRWMSAAAVLTVALNMTFLSAGPYVYRDFPLSSILSETNREQYLANRLPLRNAINLVNALNPGRTPVALFSDEQAAGLIGDALYASWYNYRFQAAYFAAKSEAALAAILLEKNTDFIIVDTNWSALGNVPKEQLALLEKVSTKVIQFGNITVRHLKSDYRFKKELLINPDYSGSNGWSLEGGATFDAEAKALITNVNSPGTQNIAVSAGRRYMNTVIARCHKEKTQGRIQVNWSDANGHFIRPDIQVFDCTDDWQEHAMEVIAPPNAAGATIYATGHTSISLEFKSVSFKQ